MINRCAKQQDTLSKIQTQFFVNVGIDVIIIISYDFTKFPVD